jgi:hypothetical protein
MPDDLDLQPAWLLNNALLTIVNNDEGLAEYGCITGDDEVDDDMLRCR